MQLSKTFGYIRLEQGLLKFVTNLKRFLYVSTFTNILKRNSYTNTTLI